MASQGTIRPQSGALDTGAFALSYLAELLRKNREGLPGETFFEQCRSLAGEGILEYIRQMSTSDPQSKDLPASTPTSNLQTFPNVNTKADVENKDGKFTVTIPLGSFVTPENLRVTIQGRELLIDVKTESKSDDGSTRMHLEFSKTVHIPDEVNVDEVKTVLSPDGVLKIQASTPQANTRPVEIQVKRIRLDTSS